MCFIAIFQNAYKTWFFYLLEHVVLISNLSNLIQVYFYLCFQKVEESVNEDEEQQRLHGGREMEAGQEVKEAKQEEGAQEEEETSLFSSGCLVLWQGQNSPTSSLYHAPRLP